MRESKPDRYEQKIQGRAVAYVSPARPPRKLVQPIQTSKNLLNPVTAHVTPLKSEQTLMMLNGDLDSPFHIMRKKRKLNVKTKAPSPSI